MAAASMLCNADCIPYSHGILRFPETEIRSEFTAILEMTDRRLGIGFAWKIQHLCRGEVE